MTEEIKRKRRPWIKLFVENCLYGSIMEEFEDPAERWVWIGFLLLAGDSPFEGKICATPTEGFTDNQLASKLKCEPRLLTSAKAKMVRHEKIQVLPNNVIVIINWKKYQSDYMKKLTAKKRRAYRARRASGRSPS